MKRDTRPVQLPEPTAATLRKMWAKIEVPSGCWIWKGAKQHPGYPVAMSVDGSRINSGPGTYRPQRLMFHWFKYPIPDGFTVDHLCKNKMCVNPDHMEDVTQGENARRAHKRKYCKRGHPQIPKNRYSYMSKLGKRERCLPCMRIPRNRSSKA